MVFLSVYAVSVIILVMAYIIKKDYISKHDFELFKDFILTIFRKKVESKIIEVPKNGVNNQNYNLHSSAILLKSLRHLDFMTQLEHYLETSETTRFKEKVLSEFEVSKIEAQISVLKSARLLSQSTEIAA